MCIKCIGKNPINKQFQINEHMSFATKAESIASHRGEANQMVSILTDTKTHNAARIKVQQFVGKCRLLRPILLPAVLQTQYLSILYNHWNCPTTRKLALEELNWWAGNGLTDWLSNNPLDNSALSHYHPEFHLKRPYNLLAADSDFFPHKIYTDASRFGWGACRYPGEQKAQGPFPYNPMPMTKPVPSSNWRELFAVGEALQSFKDLENTRILIRTDNSTTAAYINREGGIVLNLVTQVKKLFFDIVWPRRLSLYALHVRGVDNRIADQLSRKRYQ